MAEEQGDTSDEIVHRQLDTDRDEPGVQVIEVIAGLEGVATTELSPLYDTIDHLISELFSNPPSPTAQAKVEFLYEGYRINLYQEGSATFVKLPHEKT